MEPIKSEDEDGLLSSCDCGLAQPTNPTTPPQPPPQHPTPRQLYAGPPVANLSGKDATKSRGSGLNGLAEASLGLESSAKNLWREAKRGSAVIMSQVGQAMNNNL